MAEVIFSHPEVKKGPLIVSTGADLISWAYGLNTATYDTYGGQIVQILSCYIEDLEVLGTVGKYRTGDYRNPGLEEVYKWFNEYFEVASPQGDGPGGGDYTDAIKFEYPARGWSMSVKPKEAPGFRLSTDTVAPNWRVNCHVVEEDLGLNRLTFNHVTSVEGVSGVQGFLRVNANIGFDQDNPFSNPFPGKKKHDRKDINEAFSAIGDYFSGLVTAYKDGDFGSLLGSKPPDFLNPSGKGPTGEDPSSDSSQTTSSIPPKKI